MSIDTPFVRGAERLRVRIATIRKSLDLPALKEEIATLLIGRTRRRFAAQLDPDGRKWKEVSPSTKRRKAREGAGAAPTLVRSGKLRDAIAVIRGGLGSTSIATGAGIRIGVQDEEVANYARAHQQGLGVTMRRFLGIGELDIKAVDTLMRRKARQLERLGT